MAKTDSVYARVEPELKKEVEDIFSELGISTSTAINIFYRQVRMNRGLPFDLRLQSPLIIDDMSEDDLDESLTKADESIKKGNFKDASEALEDFRVRYGL